VLRLATAVAAVFPAVASAAIPLADDFESGALLLSDGGQWSWFNDDNPALNTVAASDAGAHRGNFGLRVSDGDGAAGDHAVISVVASFPGTSNDLYARAWVRLITSNGLGDCYFMSLGSSSSSYAVLQILDGGVALTGFDGNGHGSAPLPPLAWSPGEWHLVELGTKGMGTDAGTRTAWVDGVQAGQTRGIDWSGATVVDFSPAVGWEDNGSFTGTFDLDDVRLSESPPASRLSLDAGAAPLSEGGCRALTVSLLDVTGAPAPAPYDVHIGLAATGVPGELFADTACATAGGTFELATGSSELTASFRPAGTGAGTLSATHPDFLSDAVPVVVGGGADGGPEEPFTWYLGCGCSSDPVALGVAVLLFLARRHRVRKDAAACPVSKH
jgi:hypothetical protein